MCGGGTATHNNTNETTSISNYCFLLDLRVRGNNKGNWEKIKPTAARWNLVSANYVREAVGRRHVLRESATHVNSRAALPKVKERTDSSPSSHLSERGSHLKKKRILWGPRAPLEITRLCGSNIITCERSAKEHNILWWWGPWQEEANLFLMPTAARFSHQRPCQLVRVLCAESESGLNTLRKMHLISTAPAANKLQDSERYFPASQSAQA